MKMVKKGKGGEEGDKRRERRKGLFLGGGGAGLLLFQDTKRNTRAYVKHIERLVGNDFPWN
jgi:hypothetical protein